jgi:hypothetical protein
MSDIRVVAKLTVKGKFFCCSHNVGHYRRKWVVPTDRSGQGHAKKPLFSPLDRSRQALAAEREAGPCLLTFLRRGHVRLLTSIADPDMSYLLLVYGLIVWFSVCQRSIRAKDVGDQTQTTAIRINNTLARHGEEGKSPARRLQTMTDDVPEVHINLTDTTASTAVRECKIPKVTPNQRGLLVRNISRSHNVSASIRTVSG